MLTAFKIRIIKIKFSHMFMLDNESIRWNRVFSLGIVSEKQPTCIHILMAIIKIQTVFNIVNSKHCLLVRMYICLALSVLKEKKIID